MWVVRTTTMHGTITPTLDIFPSEIILCLTPPAFKTVGTLAFLQTTCYSAQFTRAKPYAQRPLLGIREVSAWRDGGGGQAVWCRGSRLLGTSGLFCSCTKYLRA